MSFHRTAEGATPRVACRDLSEFAGLALAPYASGVSLAAREQAPERCAAEGRCRLLLELRQRPRFGPSAGTTHAVRLNAAADVAGRRVWSSRRQNRTP